MSEPEAVAGLRKIRTYLLESISLAADEIAAIDEQLKRYTETAKMIEEEKSIRSDDHRVDGTDLDEEVIA